MKLQKYFQFELILQIDGQDYTKILEVLNLKKDKPQKKTGDDDLVEFIEKNPSSTLKETANHFSVCHQAIHRRSELLGMKKYMNQKEKMLSA
jgi:predicted HTH transcriptional regulator